MANYRLISFELCPFVQRSTIALEEKGIAYDIEHIDLQNKPTWFLDISPLGKVPTLVVEDGTVLFESTVINEYLDEICGEPLHPVDPLERAHDRAWIVLSTTALSSLFGFTAAMDEASARDKADILRGHLDRLETHLGEGPYWHGESFCLMDAATAPMLQRLHWVDAFVPQLQLLADRPRLRRWTEALVTRESVRRSTVPDIEKRFRDYTTRERGDARRLSWVGERALASAHSLAG